MNRILVIVGLVVAIGTITAPVVLAADPLPTDYKNAAKYCKALREAKGVEAFQAQYGTNKNKKNAFGKCVSSVAKAKAKKREDAEQKAEDAKASTACKKLKAQDADKFARTYKNFGQCMKAQKAGKDKNGKDDDDQD
jgi:hypothetical protein